ncbi:hypothetical protein CASFOL_031528 [Castilleja foliolosa]|uniref:Protein WUSCHEL n=1 Tax=Castilleja foliolosa TaxID=1961234 RepID=A0ABD3C4Y1_9LAMI
MASSNKHWPSMFKSKPTNTSHQWQHDINSGHHRNPYTPEPVCEEKPPEPKPRWSPKPEQIRILESIFNSGIINPPRDEIRKIRVQLQAYGQVGDANVFYWFQNRKSRSKHKQRQLHQTNKPQLPAPAPAVPSAAPTPSSSSSDKSSTRSSNYENTLSPTSNNNSPTVSVNRPIFVQAPGDFLTEPLFFTGQQSNGGSLLSTSIGLTQGFCFHVDDDHRRDVGNCSTGLLGELMPTSHGFWKKDEHDEKKMKMQHNSIYSPSHVMSPNNYHVFQGVLDLGESSPPPKTTVFINDMSFELPSGPFNVRETFGEDVVLLYSSGNPVPTNEWGLTEHPLQNGAFYYLLRAVTPSQDDHEKTIHLI